VQQINVRLRGAPASATRPVIKLSTPAGSWTASMTTLERGNEARRRGQEKREGKSDFDVRHLRGAPASAPRPVITLSTPAGSFTASAMAAISRHVTLACSLGFRMAVLPEQRHKPPIGSEGRVSWSGSALSTLLIATEVNRWQHLV